MNHKGGVGKTTSTVNIGAGLHQLGKRVLLIDLDPQANLTMHLCGEPDPAHDTIYGALRSEYGLPVKPIKPAFDIVISTLDLSAAELELQSEPGREYILKELISPYLKDYDYILIDCPPSLGILTINALSASTEIIIPVESSAFSLKGMTKLFDIVEKVKYRLNKNLKSYKILITKYDSRKTIQRQITESIKAQRLAPVFDTVIRTNVALEEASMSQCSVFDHDSRSAGAIDYTNICKEIIK
jgi:chromosome partitioning protein